MAQTTLAFVCQKGTPLSDTFWLTMSLSLLKKAQNTQNLYPHKKGPNEWLAHAILLAGSTGKWRIFVALPGNLFTKALTFKAGAKQIVF
jgi:hypothetical protein